MFEKIKEIIELLKLLYIKVSIACCCKSDCQIGRDSDGNKIPEPQPPSPSGDDITTLMKIEEHLLALYEY